MDHCPKIYRPSRSRRPYFCYKMSISGMPVGWFYRAYKASVWRKTGPSDDLQLHHGKTGSLPIYCSTQPASCNSSCNACSRGWARDEEYDRWPCQPLHPFPQMVLDFHKSHRWKKTWSFSNRVGFASNLPLVNPINSSIRIWFEYNYITCIRRALVAGSIELSFWISWIAFLKADSLLFPSCWAMANPSKRTQVVRFFKLDKLKMFYKISFESFGIATYMYTLFYTGVSHICNNVEVSKKFKPSLDISGKP